MMTFYNLKCEVPGSLGTQTIFDKQVTPWVVKGLHVIFDGWLGAELLTVSSTLLVTESLMNTLSFNFSGIVNYEHFYVEESENFRILQPDVDLPKFSRMIIASNPFKDDFALTRYNGLYNQLIISNRALEILQGFNLGNYSIEIADQHKAIL
jgi:hypothetical protein